MMQTARITIIPEDYSERDPSYINPSKFSFLTSPSEYPTEYQTEGSETVRSYNHSQSEGRRYVESYASSNTVTDTEFGQSKIEGDDPFYSQRFRSISEYTKSDRITSSTASSISSYNNIRRNNKDIPIAEIPEAYLKPPSPRRKYYICCAVAILLGIIIGLIVYLVIVPSIIRRTVGQNSFYLYFDNANGTLRTNNAVDFSFQGESYLTGVPVKASIDAGVLKFKSKDGVTLIEELPFPLIETSPNARSKLNFNGTIKIGDVDKLRAMMKGLSGNGLGEDLNEIVVTSTFGITAFGIKWYPSFEVERRLRLQDLTISKLLDSLLTGNQLPSLLNPNNEPDPTLQANPRPQINRNFQIPTFQSLGEIKLSENSVVTNTALITLANPLPLSALIPSASVVLEIANTPIMRARAINLTLPNPNSNAVDINPSFELTLLTSMNDVVAKVRESITRFTTTGSFPISIAGPIDWSLPNSNDSAQATAEQFRSPFPFAIESAPWLAQVTSDLKIDVPIPLLVNAVLTQFPQIVTLLDGQNQNNPVNPDPAAPPGTNIPINLPIRIPPDLLPNLFNLLNSLSVSSNVFVSPDQKLLNIPVEIQNLPSVKVVPTFRVNYTVGVDVGLPLVGSTGVRLFVGDVSLQSSTNTPDLRRFSLNITLLSSSDSAFVFPIQTPQTPVLTSPPSPDPALNPVIPSPNSDPQINPSLPPPTAPSSFSSFLSSSSDGTSNFVKNVMSGLSNQVFSNLISTVGSDGFMKFENITISPSVSSYLSSLSSSTPSILSTSINPIPQSDSSSPVSVQSVSSSAEPTQPQPQPQSQQSETKQTGSECILCSTFNQFGFQVPLNDMVTVTTKFIQNML